MNTITSLPGGGIVCEGPKAVSMFQLLALKSALNLEIRCPGLTLSRRGSALSVAKRITGLKSNKREVHIARIEQMIAETAKEINQPQPA